jgi:alanyl-tRNA synthetase
MTERLYYTDSYATEFDARITALAEADSRPALVLDRSLFYPTSGGQPYDTGTLGGWRVIDVVAADGGLLHVVDAAPGAGDVGRAVHGAIDWPRRYDHMQQHSGQHLISQVFFRLFGHETVSVHFGDQESTLDLDAPALSQAQLDDAEQMAADLVYRSLPITAYFVGDADLHRVPLRRPPAVTGQIRIVEIAAFDYSACGGTHCRTTAEVGPVKFLRQERQRGKARITFLCGRRATADYVLKHRLLAAAAALFSNEMAQVPELIARSLQQVKELQRSLEALTEQQLAHEAEALAQAAEALPACKLVARRLDDKAPDALKALASLLQAQPDTVALLASAAGGKSTVLFARSAGLAALNAGELLRASLRQFGGGGGGRPDFAQGGGVAPDTLDDLLAFAAQQVRVWAS